VPNGCSGGVGILWRTFTGADPCFTYCCDEHDLFYEQGGSEEDRKFADGLLRDCMIRDGHPILAWIFYIAVQKFGASHWRYV